MTPFKEAMLSRRSQYGLTKDNTVTQETLENVLKTTLKHMPSAYHSQHQRAMLLLDDAHTKLWKIVWETLKKEIKPEQHEATEAKVQGFARSHGTILFFDDTETIENLQSKFPLYKEKWAEWANHAQGMFQYATWTHLATLGLGASLQHYNPLIDEAVREAFDVPESWRLIAQMPFGSPTKQPKEKTFMPMEKRFKVHT